MSTHPQAGAPSAETAAGEPADAPAGADARPEAAQDGDGSGPGATPPDADTNDTGTNDTGTNDTGTDDTRTAGAGTDVGKADTGGTEAEGTDAGEGVSEGGDTGGAADPAGSTDGAQGPTEAEAELAAQREVRERIERRKAEREAPIDSGAKLSGTAAELLAAVRAVESGERPARTFAEPTEAPRSPAPAAAPAPRPVTASVPAPAPGPAPSTVSAVRTVLTEGGAPESLAPQVSTALGEDAGSVLRADPWQLLQVAGVRPEQADGFARALLGPDCRPDDERRGRAVTVWLLGQAALAGHTALDAPALSAALAQRSVPAADEALRGAVAEGEVLVFQDALDAAPQTDGAPTVAVDGSPVDGTPDEEAPGEEAEPPVRVLIGLERFALAEESLADGLSRLVNAPAGPGDGPDEARGGGAVGSAAELIRASATHALVLHTGGEAARAEPAALVAGALARGQRVVAATHTADGRDRFAKLLTASNPAAPVPAAAVVTVAGLLAGTEGPGRDAEGALAVDLLVVLDAPQLDVENAAMLVESLGDGARLVLSGDPALLWSAGPGRVFADLLAARVCPQIASRTPDPGPIGELTSSVAFGELPQVEAPGKEVVIVPVRDAGEAVHRTVQLVADSLPRALGVPPEGTQVITPGHGGAAGTRALNSALKERLNPGPGRFGGFDPGDRIVWSPAPGRSAPGRVVGADAEGLRLECDGAPVLVPREQVERTVRHGWAMTAHQAVGRRWPAAVVVLPGDAAQALSRPWVYTAFGRGEQHLSVVHGVEQALPQAVAEGAPKPRTTRLPVLLRGQGPTSAG
ncbi:helix-hairpin-helix domain-containing protein [Streptomyces sp. NPDC127068]|uniref:helix-hairpin-helix domain-containing protein n=1 Tax=Streptomyces sp. NPDC127068 TaxID=3347127 RepID=UPI003648C221